MAQILVTGSDGRLGRLTVRALLRETSYDVLAASIDGCDPTMEDVWREFGNRLSFVSNDALLGGNLDEYEVEGAIHLAFSRRDCSPAQIADSVDFAAKVFGMLAEYRIRNVAYMSSQGVYGQTQEIRTEETPVSPVGIYSMAKYAAEVLQRTQLDEELNYTALRLDPVAQSQNSVRGLCRSAKHEGIIKLVGGRQTFSFIDEEDVASALVTLMSSNRSWKPVYNVGTNMERVTLTELADIVSNIADNNGYSRPRIETIDKDIELWAGMDASLFMNDTGWHPKYGLTQTIAHVFESV